MKLPILASSLLISATAFAATPLDGLTVAVSPDGSKLVAGGDTRTLLVLDPATLEVKERIWAETTLTALKFSSDGSVLAAQDTDGSVLLYDTAKWTKVKQFPKCDRMTTAQTPGLFAGSDEDYAGAKITVRTLKDGTQKGQVQLEKDFRVEALAIDESGKKLAVLSQAKDDSAEKKLGYNDTPKDLRGLAKSEFEEKNNGRTSLFRIYDIASGKQLSEAKLWYSPNLCTVRFIGDDILVSGYSNVNARITPKGDITLFEQQNSYNYGTGYSGDGSLLMTGGLRDATITTTADMAAQKLEISKLPGWPEYFKGFDADKSGNVYGGTTAYRIIKIKGGKVEKEAPVK